MFPDVDPFSELWEEASEQYIRFRLVKAKKRPGFDDPLDWLMFPPEGFKTDIVVGMGRELGNIAQLWKELYQCKSVCVDGFGDLLPDPKEMNIQPASECLEMFLETDVNVAIGPKMHEERSRDLRFYNKQVFKLTPGIISYFSDVSHGNVNKNERKFHVLVLGSGEPNCFEEEGLTLLPRQWHRMANPIVSLM